MSGSSSKRTRKRLAPHLRSLGEESPLEVSTSASTSAPTSASTSASASALVSVTSTHQSARRREGGVRIRGRRRKTDKSSYRSEANPDSRSMREDQGRGRVRVCQNMTLMCTFTRT